MWPPAGLLFETPQQLSQQLLDLFRDFPGAEAAAGGEEQRHPGGGDLLARLRAGVRGEAGLPRWHNSWRHTVLPVLEGQKAEAAAKRAS